MAKKTVLDLFSGIGGFSLGLESTGLFETVKFVEKDPYCIKVLNKNFPNVPIEEDIKNVKGREFEADVITGGFPCQPVSVAGKQKGTSDDRYLWPEMFRIIREVKPQFVIGENVQGIINIQDGMVLRQVQDDLEGEGFEVQCFLIPASGIGAWHRRNRVWIVGYSEHNGSLATKIKGRNIEIATGQQERPNETTEPERTSGSRDNENVSNTESVSSNEREPRNSEEKSREERQVRNEVRGNDGHGVTKDVSDTSKIRSSSESIRDIESLGEESNREKETGNQSSVCIETRSSNVSNTDSGLRRGRTAIGESGENKVWRFYSEEEEQPRVNIRSQTIGRNVVYGSTQSWWQIESEFCRVPNGISYELDKNRAKRIKALGNAIVPQIAREIGLAIMKVASNE
jgi:DNA (cytosine-5)-methyltransferase 1